MKTLTRSDDLQILGGFLQERLQLELPQGIPFQVQCVFKDGDLIILAQHPPGAAPDAQETFKVLQEAVVVQQPEFPPTSTAGTEGDSAKATYKVKLYLRAAGQKQPYAFDTFAVEPPARSQSSENPFDWGGADAKESSTDTLSASVVGERQKTINVGEFNPPSVPENQITDEPARTANPWERPIRELDLKLDDMRGNTSAQEPFSAQSSASESDESNFSSTPDDRGTSPTVDRKRLWLSMLLAGAGIAAVFFFCSLYALTRPCAIGKECKAIAQAEQLSNKSAQILQRPKSGKEILVAQQRLGEAIAILQTIPYWSSHYKNAQNLVKAYQTQAQKLDEVIEALKKAARASVKSQNPPHSTSEWAEIQKLWREATLDLEKVPKNSNVYRLAKQKQKAYKVNLALVNKRLITEQQAKQLLDAGNIAAKMAEARQGVAQTLESWFLVYNTWQTAVKRLSQIPPGTTAYEQAQQLLTDYQLKLAAVRDRTITEQFAANVYKQSLLIAQQAKNFQAIYQWSQAVVNWSNALAYLKQIPKGTFYYNKTQPQIASYTDSMKQAQVQLQIATMMQQASNDLKLTCAGKPKICDYSITKNTIKVRLTPNYMETVRKAALSARARNDYNAQAGVVKHVLTLGEALEAISDNARIRLEVYTPDGSLRQTHNP